MKKLFALILAVVMICAMSVSVFADEPETTTDHVVGTHGSTGNPVSDGLTESGFASNNPEYEVNITATVGSVEHRYAVDIEYQDMSFDIAANNLVWNVNTLKYDVKNPEAATIGTNKAYPITVTNYSDLPVNLAVTVDDKFSALNDKDDFADVAASTDANGTTEFTGTQIAKAVGATNTTAGQAQTATFYITVIATDWNKVANYYANYFTANGQPSEIIATATITVTKVS